MNRRDLHEVIDSIHDIRMLLRDMNANEVKSHIEDGTLDKWLANWMHHMDANLRDVDIFIGKVNASPGFDEAPRRFMVTGKMNGRTIYQGFANAVRDGIREGSYATD